MSDTRNIKDSNTLKQGAAGQQLDAFVLDKGIFSNVFDKDIKRVYVYKKAERLAKAIHLVSPAFRNSPAMRDRIDRIAMGLVDAAVLPPATARAGGLLSAMNADLIAREAQHLLHEVAGYEEPRLFLEDAPTLAELARSSAKQQPQSPRMQGMRTAEREGIQVSSERASSKGQTPETPARGGRQEAILDILSKKGPSYIKDISIVVRDVSEKTIQRELQALVEAGKVTKTGERRWTTYTIAS